MRRFKSTAGLQGRRRHQKCAHALTAEALHSTTGNSDSKFRFSKQRGLHKPRHAHHHYRTQGRGVGGRRGLGESLSPARSTSGSPGGKIKPPANILVSAENVRMCTHDSTTSRDGAGSAAGACVKASSSFVARHEGQNQSPSGTSVKGGDRQSMCHPPPHLSHNSITSSLSGCPHTLQHIESIKTGVCSALQPHLQARIHLHCYSLHFLLGQQSLPAS